MNTGVDLMVLDSLGKNLLDPLEQHGFTLDSTDVFYLKDGRIYCDQFSWFDVFQSENFQFVMRLRLYFDESQDSTRTVVNCPNGAMDTLRDVFDFYPPENRVDLKYADYNGD